MKDYEHPSYDGSAKEIVSFKQFEELIEKLAQKIDKYDKAYDFVYGIPRGGLVPAVYISHYLNIPLKVEITDLEFEQENLRNKILIVDDLVDTGKALVSYQNFDCAVLYRKPWAKTQPTYWVDETDKWIVFPWEKQRL